MTRLTPLVVTVALLVGCVGNRPLTTGDPCPCAPGWSCDPTTETCVAGDSVVTDGSCSATCSNQTDSTRPFASVDYAYSFLAGTWQICTDMMAWQSIDAPSDVVGIEFGPGSGTSGGDAYYLVQGPSGPVRGSGFAYQLTYGVSELGSQSLLSISPTPNSEANADVNHSTCPAEIEWYGSVLVRF